MDLHTLKKAPGARKARKRVGRGHGSGHGKTSGRGHKGQKSRAGYTHRYGFEGGQMPLHRRLPKRGFKHDKRWSLAIVNVDTLGAVFEAGSVVTAEDLVKAGLADESKGGVKILGRGEIARKLTLKVHAISPGARAKVEAAGGSVEILGRTVLAGAGEVPEHAGTASAETGEREAAEPPEVEEEE